MSALVLGGYGNFGKLISMGLVKNNVHVIIAGRNQNKAQQLKLQINKNINNNNKILNQHKDTNSYSYTQSRCNVQAVGLNANLQLKQFVNNYNNSNNSNINKIKVVINTYGPFLPYSQSNFDVLKQCMATNVNYIDLSDGRQYIQQIAKLTKQAQINDITAITGASTAPGLTTALIQHFLKQFTHIQRVYYGFSPGQKSDRGGEATAKGVMSYVGKKIASYDNLAKPKPKPKPKYGWQDIYAQYYKGVGYRLMGNVDHPDLDIFPSKYNINNIQFHAGVESKILHLSIWVASWLVRAGIPLNLTKYSSMLLNISHILFNWMGTQTGVMHFVVQGNDRKGNKCKKKWFLIAEQSHGPNVATAPAVILATKMCKDNYKLVGVHPCAGLVSLQQIQAYLTNFKIRIYVEEQ